MSSRICLRHHGSFSTGKNNFRISRTSGRKYKALYLKKKSSFVVCGDKKKKLNGIKRPGVSGFTNISKNKKNISRVYGGCLSGQAVKERIVKAFLVEEQKIVKKVLEIQNKKL
mmetsp:Transcript_49443/g.100921  ORF Transcript_49443/g.100921 Transcript_49443/m.100921 type:complete len:113 (+) Transcript_49443:37-375(+)